ncbi:MAG: tetratricopeptide repeat protein [Myxococcota bacterium]
MIQRTRPAPRPVDPEVMGLFRRPAFDRVRLLEAADRARRKGRRRRAVRLYREVLAVEPRNPELNARIAPLLAATGQSFDAWRAYLRAIEHCRAEKQLEAAVTLARGATRSLPRQIEPWEQLARLEAGRGRREAAREALRRGRRAMKGRRRRPQAIALLRLALELDPDDVQVTVDLARQLARSDQTLVALRLLEGLAERCEGAGRRAARAAQWRIEPSLQNTGAWMHSAWACWRQGPVRSGARAPRAAS